MIDLHCHILPGLDDGAGSENDTLEMARIAVQGGTTEIACTPHCSTDDPYLPDRLRTVLSSTARANAMLRREGIGLLLHSGMELLCVTSPGPLLAQGEYLTLGGSRYLLIEFPFDIRSSAINDAAETVASAGLVPVIAHPERYYCVQWVPELVAGWAERGWLIQINRGSVTGGFGNDVRLAADWILRRSLAHLVASDAHSAEYRTPDLSEGYRWVARNCSRDYAELLFQENPQRVLDDRSVAGSR
jgi:protein-tyrosine phosphatase